MQSEILTLTWRRVDFTEGTLRLDLGTTKNDDGRLVYMTPEVKRMLGDQLRGRQHGKRIQDFKKAWKTACPKAGCSDMLRHDFRRTAVRNMERAEVARSVATKVTGYTSYLRYAIVSGADLQEVVRKLAGIVSGKVPTMPANS